MYVSVTEWKIARSPAAPGENGSKTVAIDMHVERSGHDEGAIDRARLIPRLAPFVWRLVGTRPPTRKGRDVLYTRRKISFCSLVCSTP